MKILPTMPYFKTEDDRVGYSRLLTGIAVAISGSWFSQIAYLSIILKKSGMNSPVAVYFFCAYFPVVVLTLFWARIISQISLKKALPYSQFCAAGFAFIQIVTLIKPNLYLFFGATFLRGICSSVLYLAYDTLIINHYSKPRDVHRANVLLNAVRYGGLIVFPLVGGYCSEVLGDNIAIMVDGLSNLAAFIIFSNISHDYYNVRSAVDPVANSKLTIGACFAFTVPFLNQFAYGIFNYLLPIYLFIYLGVQKYDYGWTMSLSGMAFLIAARLTSSQILSNIRNANQKLLAITSTVLNGVLLYMAFTSHEFYKFNIYIFLASAISLVSITSVKTLLIGSFRHIEPKKLSARYNFPIWFGSAFGYIFCAIVGNYVSLGFLVICVMVILIVSSFMILRHINLPEVEVRHENPVEV